MKIQIYNKSLFLWRDMYFQNVFLIFDDRVYVYDEEVSLLTPTRIKRDTLYVTPVSTRFTISRGIVTGFTTQTRSIKDAEILYYLRKEADMTEILRNANIAKTYC